MRFLLGTHQPSWLPRSPVSLFVSAVALRRVRFLGARTTPAARRKRRTFRARAPWALDSGGFSELDRHGRHSVEPRVYVAEVRRWRRIIGELLWAAIQDWMCEPHMLVRTGSLERAGGDHRAAVREHQERTIESLATLRRLAPEIPWRPVLQGWHVADYLEHVEMYLATGFDLRLEPIVGVGSVCRRQGTREADEIMRAIVALGIRIHAFGVKRDGLARFGDAVASADSMAWSFVARRRGIRLPGHTHKNCANCFDFAMQWCSSLLESVDAPAPGRSQLAMPW